MIETPLFIIDDDPVFSGICEGMLRDRGIGSVAFRTLDELMDSPTAQMPSAIILDWQLGATDALVELPSIQSRFPYSPIVLTTGAPTVQLVVRAMKAGVFDFLAKPLEDEARLFATVSKAIAHGRLLQRVESASGVAGGQILLGGSEAIRQVMDTLRMAAPTDATILVLGESGTGKELAAQEAHRLSRRTGPMVNVNMAALPRELVESTLFGHERGSFTGADKRRAGLCEQAAEGTVFFDEIGEMPLDLQAKLLRFLQDRTFRRVGGTEEVKVDVRIVAATNRDLLEEVRDGRFREDLFYRLNTITVEMPPLRTRPDDIPVLAMHFLRDLAGRYGRGFVNLSAEAIELLLAYDWPGNVRELRQAIERSVVLHDAPELAASMLPASVQRSVRPAVSARTVAPPTPAPPTTDRTVETDRVAAVSGAVAEGEPELMTLEEMERKMIERAMAKADGSAREAAKILGISLATLYRRIKP